MKTLEGTNPSARGAHIYRTGGKSIRTRPLDCNDGAARRVAPANGPDPKLRSASCLQVSLSQVRDAYGPHDGNEHTRRAIASDGVHSAQQSGPAGLAYSFSPNAPRCHWHECSTAPHGDVEIRRFRVTHPYHPLFQQEFELVSYRQDWGEDRVWFQDKLGRLHSLPTSWTDAGAVDPFVALAAGRSLFRVADLIELARQIDGWKSERVERTVKENMS